MEQAPAQPAGDVRVPRFAPPDILWYFGALVAAIAGDALILDTSAANRGIWILLVGLVLMAFFGALAALLIRAGRTIAGGTLATAVVLLVPATEIGFERLFGVHPRTGSSSVTLDIGPVGIHPAGAGNDFHGAPFAIALGTVVVGLGVYWLVRFAFVLLPVAVGLAIAAELFLPAVVKHPSVADYVTAALVTGLVFFVIGLLLDARRHRREAFWWYVLGLFEVAGTFVYFIGARHHGWVWIVLLAVAAVTLLASAPLGRASWASYAVVGIAAALGHYADAASGSWRTPLLFTAIGLVLVLAGVVLDVAGATFVGRLTRPWRPRSST